MFQRRRRFHLGHRVRDFVWPRIGWRRSTRYLLHRVGRIPGTPGAVAAGFASGAASSMTPFIGFHFLIAFAIAWVTRGSLFAAAVGTVVGNPWTFPFIWYASYELGCRLLGSPPGHNTAERVTLDLLIHHPWEAFLPLTIGGCLLALLVWPITYFAVKPLVYMYRERRQMHRMARLSAWMEKA